MIIIVIYLLFLCLNVSQVTIKYTDYYHNICKSIIQYNYSYL